MEKKIKELDKVLLDQKAVLQSHADANLILENGFQSPRINGVKNKVEGKIKTQTTIVDIVNGQPTRQMTIVKLKPGSPTKRQNTIERKESRLSEVKESPRVNNVTD